VTIARSLPLSASRARRASAAQRQSWIKGAAARQGRGTAGALALVGAVLGGITVSALGCGSSYPASEYPPAPPPGLSVTEDDLSPAPPGVLWRRDVDAVLDAGLGRFLQHVDVQPEFDQGNFLGFRVVELRPPGWWQGVDLAPGDVVTQVNGMPIEQPTQAHDAFESLRKADKLEVSVLRAGQKRDLTYIIRESGKSTAARAPQTPGATPASTPPSAQEPPAPAAKP
jgi:S1-C subfamily serine protease